MQLGTPFAPQLNCPGLFAGADIDEALTIRRDHEVGGAARQRFRRRLAEVRAMDCLAA